MKIKKITLDNILCFKHLEIDLSNGKTVADWIVLLGNNGVGKTTLMRSIALCLCEESGASGLLDELASDLIRKESRKKIATVRIEFEPLETYKRLPYIETTIKKTRFGEIELTQTIYPKNFKIWDKLFICGYGANRRSYGTISYNEYTVTDAIYSLFNYKTDMQNIELNFRRIEREINLEKLFRKMEDILMLEKGAIRMQRNGVHVKGEWGSYMPMGALGDGYQATMAWIMDMYGWKLLYETKLKDAEIKGIVFIDELEQHLHPVWQMEIINRLSRQFKGVQFIITTHSPLVALNSINTYDQKQTAKSFVLEWQGNQVNVSEIEEPLRDLDYDQILASEAFGHISNQNTEISKILRELSKLASIDKLTKPQSVKLEKIKQVLKGIMFPQGTTLIEREVEREYRQELINKNKELRAILKDVKNDKD